MAANNRLTSADVIYVLQCGDADDVVAKRLGVSRQTVNSVRIGKAYARVAPQLPRRDAIPRLKSDGLMCTGCDFWDGWGCAFGLPESLKDLRFAQECSMYEIHHLTP